MYIWAKFDFLYLFAGGVGLPGMLWVLRTLGCCRQLLKMSVMNKQVKSEKSIVKKAWNTFYKGNFDEALELFHQAWDDGKDLMALYGRACALFRSSDYEGALADLSELIRNDENNPSFIHTRALVYGANEDYDNALKDLKTVTTIAPDNGEAWCDLGGLYLVLDSYKEADICFQKSADIDKSCACAWFGKGMLALMRKEYKKAGEYMNIVLKLDGKHVPALMARADIAFGSGQKKGALKDVIKALMMDRDFFERFREYYDERDTGQHDILDDSDII